jgi:hypothetical protein
MPYLICDKCNVSYEIEKIEEMEDFHTCTCGNELKFYETIEEYMNEESSIATEEENDGIFYSINKKNLVYMQMSMLKEQKETEEKERNERDLRYRIRHAIAENKEKMKGQDYEPIIVKEFGDKSLKKKKELLLREMELLIKSKNEK